MRAKLWIFFGFAMKFEILPIKKLQDTCKSFLLFTPFLRATCCLHKYTECRYIADTNLIITKEEQTLKNNIQDIIIELWKQIFRTDIQT